jgi:hypothetical protein
VHIYDPKTKHFHHHTPRKQDKFNVKHRRWLSTFIKKAIVHHDHAPYAQTVNKHFRLEILRYLDGADASKLHLMQRILQMHKTEYKRCWQ